MPSLTFRRFAPGDTAKCLELYDLNEPDRFPAGVRDDYATLLNNQSIYVLISEKDGRVVACGGLYYHTRKDIAGLCFGLVHPQFQRMGIGTALLLARLALLDPSRPRFVLLISAVEKSIGFYRRLGFRRFAPWKDKQGQLHPSGYLFFSSRQIQHCRKLLADHGISVPQDEKLVPVYEQPHKTG